MVDILEHQIELVFVVLGFPQYSLPRSVRGLSGILCAGPGFPSGSDEAFAEHDGELGLGLGPFARRHFPFPDDLAQDEKDELRRRLIARKMASRSHRSP